MSEIPSDVRELAERYAGRMADALLGTGGDPDFIGILADAIMADRASRAPDPSRDGLVEAVEAAWSQFINCRGDPSGDKAEDEAEEQRNVLALSAAIQALAPSVVAEPPPPRAYCDICSSPNACKDGCQSPPYRTPSPHKGEPDVLRDAVAILKRLSILRIPPYDLPADSFLEKAATEIITLVIAAPPPTEGMVLVPEDLLTHIGDWRNACQIARFHAKPASMEEDDPSYWEHQLKTLDKIEAALSLAATPNHPEPGAGE